MVSKLWRDYLSTLKRLKNTVQLQTASLQSENWHQLRVIYGEKKNIYDSLQIQWNKLSEIYDTKIKDRVDQKDQNQIRLEEIKEKAKTFIKEIQSIENINRDLILEKRESAKNDLTKAREFKRNHKKYINTRPIKSESGFNLVR